MTDASRPRLPWWRDVHSLDVEVAFRAAIAAAVPLVLLLATGRIEWAPYAAFGGMTAIFGRSEAYRTRIRTVSVAAVGLVASIGLGMAVSIVGAAAGGVLWWTATALVVVLVGGVLAVNLVRAHPPTPLFFVFAVLVCGAIPIPAGEGWVRLGVGVASAAFAWALSLSGWLVRRGPQKPVIPLKPLRENGPVRWGVLRSPVIWWTIGQYVVATLLAGLAALGLGLGHPYWAVVGAAAAIPPAGAARSISRALHRVVGTAAGVVVTGLVLWPEPPAWLLVAVIALAQFGAEIFVGRHYATALVFITPLALVVAHLASPVPVEGLLVDRFVETAIGCLAAILVVLVARALPNPKPRSRAAAR
ncbi:FUSC family protein [Agromyces protaetiae]|uniref:FUSC family protein n=1 Tax=Agromyces protaetiae TaxID=2509455 RepID=A0A4P6FBS1_9MICO|nr:FUSC family protein [Agromyces protaetiae]QAY73225.1 FUSC family protein [Agromyces protaetiae]